MLLVANPDEVLTGYDLTVKEISDLKNWTQRELEALLSTLDNLIARADFDGAQDRS